MCNYHSGRWEDKTKQKTKKKPPKAKQTLCPCHLTYAVGLSASSAGPQTNKWPMSVTETIRMKTHCFRIQFDTSNTAYTSLVNT